MNYWKRQAAALLAVLAVGGLMGAASAAKGRVTRTLEYRDIQVSLDGEILDLRDAAGQTVEPFLLDGTNYLPVRALAEALGLRVAWDSADATVVLTSPEKESPRKEGAGDIGSGAYHIEIQDARVAASYTGESVIIVTYVWTNNSGATDFAYGTLSSVAFQDGVELDPALVPDSSAYSSEAEWKWVRPGAKQSLQAAFVLTSAESPVEFEVYVYGEFSDNGEAVYRSFNPSELEDAAPMGTPGLPLSASAPAKGAAPLSGG